MSSCVPNGVYKLIEITEASRAKHKFAVKRNSWPKTRGVAMNPVDHVRIPFPNTSADPVLTLLASLTEVVIINILVKRRRSHGMPRKVKRPVSLQPGGRVYFEARKRQKTSVRGHETRTLCRLCGFSRSAFSHLHSRVQVRLVRVTYNTSTCISISGD